MPAIGDDDMRDEEGGGQSAGTRAMGKLDQGSDTLGDSSGMRHWRESTITRPGLDDRGNVFFAAIEMTRMPMILTDPNLPDNPIAFANKAFLDLTGYEEDEILGRNCRFLQGAQTDRASVAELRQTVERQGSVALEILNYKRDGTPFWNAVFVGPVFDVHGTLLYFFASQLDVTRRRDTENSYRQAQKMEAIGQLTAGLAHDFNNLLQVVNGNLELMAARADEDRLRRYIDNARGAAERGAKLTRQLLAFARKSRLEARAVDMSALVRGFVEMLRGTVGTQVALRLDLAEGLPPVSIDADQLEAALLNIVINARDAMPDGGTITLSTRLEHLAGRAVDLPEGDYVVLEAVDEGEGMSPQVAERATEPFFTTKGVGKGTGLGLAMASGYVRQSRGRLEIDSELGRGTRIRMLFPPAPDDATGETEAAASDHGTAGGTNGEHILVVEDNAEVLDLAVEILTDAGYRVTAARNGEEGLRRFEESGDFDLLFTDLVMPGGMNGMMLADEIAHRAPTLPILMTTGYNEELVADGPRRPSSDVLGKPYRRTELLDRVRQAIDHPPGHRPRRRPSDFGAASI